MDGEYVLDCLEFIDADLIEEAGLAEPRKRKRWALPIAAAACLCLIVGAAWFLRGREAKEPGVQKWSPSLSAQDYFKDCGGEGGRKRVSYATLVMPPYAAALPLDGERLEAEGVLPDVEDHTGQDLDKINTDTERDNFMSAEEAVVYGLVDKVIVRPEEKSDKDE